MSDLYDDLKDPKTKVDSKTEIKGHTKDDALKEIDNGPGDPIAKTEEKKRLARMEASGAIKFDEGHRIRRESEPVKTQSSAAEPKITVPEEDRKTGEVFINLLVADHKAYKTDFLSRSALDVINLAKLEDAMPWLSDKELGRHILKVENGDVYIEGELFDSFSKERQTQLEEECNKLELQLYVNYRE